MSKALRLRKRRSSVPGAMSHPCQDKELKAIVGEPPGDDFMWCDECVRWEHYYFYKNQHPTWYGLRAHLFDLLVVSPLQKLYAWALHKLFLQKARYMVRTGQHVGRRP